MDGALKEKPTLNRFKLCIGKNKIKWSEKRRDNNNGNETSTVKMKQVGKRLKKVDKVKVQITVLLKWNS